MEVEGLEVGKAMTMEVVAVVDNPNAQVLDAILLDTRHPRRGLVEWWGGYASQELAKTLRPEEVAQWPGWRPFSMELPLDWEEGYLKSAEGKVEFVYGKPPPRQHGSGTE